MQKNFWTLRTLELVAAVVVLGVLDEVVHGSTATHQSTVILTLLY